MEPYFFLIPKPIPGFSCFLFVIEQYGGAICLAVRHFGRNYVQDVNTVLGSMIPEVLRCVPDPSKLVVNIVNSERIPRQAKLFPGVSYLVTNMSSGLHVMHTFVRVKHRFPADDHETGEKERLLPEVGNILIQYVTHIMQEVDPNFQLVAVFFQEQARSDPYYATFRTVFYHFFLITNSPGAWWPNHVPLMEFPFPPWDISMQTVPNSRFIGDSSSSVECQFLHNLLTC